jgi:hypothetical protein
MFGSRVSRRKNNTKASERKRGVKMDLLNVHEQERLKNCELVIKTGLETFYQVGQALLEIQENKLYRQEFNTFDEYLQGRWNFGSTQAYNFISSAKVISNLKMSTNVDIPQNLGQTKYLAQLDDSLQIYVWNNIVNTFETITGKVVEQEVKKHKQLNEAVKEVKSKPMLYQFETQEELIEKAKSLIPASAPLVQEVIKHVEIIKDGELMDKLEEKDIYINQLKSSLSDKNKELSQKDMSIRDSQAKLKDVELLEVEIKELKKKVESSNDIELNDLINHKEELKKEIEYDLKGFDLKDKLIKAKTEFINSTKEIILTKSENINYEFLKPLAQDLNNLVQEWLINFQKTYI